MAAGGKAAPETMLERSEEYAQACRECNDRLRRCNDALRRHLRGDAIQLSEAEPNLLDRFALLDFPELPGWKELCRLNPILVSPPELLIEFAGALNEAYAAEEPLQNLMAHHRLLALARAPIRERLMVMRRLADGDPGSPFWDDDIKKFEHARHDEIRSQLHSAVKLHDASAVARLNDEASASNWRTAVPPDLRRSLETSAARLAADHGISQLHSLLPKINDAYGAMAYEECKALLGQWLATVAATQPEVPPEMQEQIDPVQAWVAEEDARREQSAAFEQACDALQQAIDRDQSTPTIERAYQTLLRFHLDIPEELSNRYRQRLAARASALRHRRRLMYSSIAAGFILIAAIIGVVAYQHLLSQETGDAQKILAEALTDVQQGDLEKGQSLRKQLTDQHPRILHSPLILKSLSDLDDAVATERQREADFKQHLNTAVTAGLEKPNDVELEQAASLAKTTAETAQVEQFKSSLDEYRTHKQQEIDRQFAADGSTISAELDAKLTAQLLSSNTDGYAQQIQELQKHVDGLRARPGVSAGLKQAQMASLDAVLGRRLQDLEQRKIQNAALQGVRKFGSTSDKHAAALKQFLATSPDDSHCADFQRALDQLPVEQGVEAWSALVATWSNQLLPVSATSAKTRVTQVQDYVDHYSGSPFTESAKAYQTYLNLGIETAAEDGPWKGKLQKLLGNPVVSSLSYLDTLDGLRYYVTANVQVQTNELAGVIKGQNFDAITSPDLTHPTTVKLEQHLLKSTTPSISPQSVFASAAQHRLDAFTYQDWDVIGVDMLATLQSNHDMNPVLRAILLQHILQLNQPVAKWSGQDDFTKVADALVEQNVEDVEWLDPTHPADAEVIRKLQSTIEKLPPPAVAKATIIRQRQQVVGPIQFVIAGEGILLKKQDGYEIVSSTPPSIGCEAWVIGADKKLAKLGYVRDKQWVVDNSKADSVPDGSLAFIVTVQK